MNYLNEQTVRTAIDLAERCYPQYEVKFGDSINPFTDEEAVKKAFKPNPEKDKLERYIDELDDNEKAELMALMWLGRRNRNPDQWESLVNHAKNEVSDAALYIAENLSLATYLKNGLDIKGVKILA